uniref:MULE transposase domain-containing protein n=1 Tax=Lactuca sativa TaxID=4236 RepID=A0A9R1VM45_LACSA|nr:hypothetical protein LSAT_V11C500268620 [Lactuca sativa]
MISEEEVRLQYGDHLTMFCMLLNHGGKFTDFPGRKYVNGKRHYVELIDIETFYVHDIDDMMVKLGYIDENLHVEMYYHFRRPLCDLDFGLFALASDDDVRHLAKYVGQHKLIEVYTEHGQTKLHTYSMSPNPSKVRIVEIDCTPKILFLEWHDTQVEPNDVLTFEPNTNNPPVSPTRNEPSIDKVDMVSDNANIMEIEIEHSSDDNSSGDEINSGDYATQYKILQDYLLEVQTQNPDTTIKLDVESKPDLDVETRTFRRVYVCLGALKQGFAAGKRDFLGVDGAFMKGPFHGQILSAVALDGNNGIYLLAYVVVEAETLNSWTWFLTHLGDDLGLASNSNFTFISDRKKGLSSAIADLFPCAEHRYCVRHIHENMRSRWRGDKFKELLWNCSTTYTVQGFEKEMEKVRKLNQECYEWLKQIPPQHSARSHFTGRAHSDIVINNICECFNSKIIDGRDTPIINCLEFIREYIMKRIVNVEKEIDKATGPLTPTATKLLQKIKDQAEEYTTSFCGNGKYQVSGPWQDQCVVNVNQRTCS